MLGASCRLNKGVSELAGGGILLDRGPRCWVSGWLLAVMRGGAGFCLEGGTESVIRGVSSRLNLSSGSWLGLGSVAVMRLLHGLLMDPRLLSMGLWDDPRRRLVRCHTAHGHRL